MEYLKLWGILLQSAFLVWLGHYITMRSKHNSIANFKSVKPIKKKSNVPPREENAVVPEWGDQ